MSVLKDVQDYLNRQGDYSLRRECGKYCVYDNNTNERVSDYFTSVGLRDIVLNKQHRYLIQN